MVILHYYFGALLFKGTVTRGWTPASVLLYQRLILVAIDKRGREKG